MTDLVDACYSLISRSSASSATWCIHEILPSARSFHQSPLLNHYVLSVSTVFRLCPQIRAFSLRFHTSYSSQRLCRHSNLLKRYEERVKSLERELQEAKDDFNDGVEDSDELEYKLGIADGKVMLSSEHVRRFRPSSFAYSIIRPLVAHLTMSTILDLCPRFQAPIFRLLA